MIDRWEPRGAVAVTTAQGATIRAARTSADWEAIRDLCCRTGAAGGPIDPRRWSFFAELWVGPYQRIVPEWTRVADAAGELVGYLTGCPDTSAFLRSRPLAFTLPVLLRVARGGHRWNADTRRFVGRALGLGRDPETVVLNRLPAGFLREYPAHLHMNVEAAFRGRGVGRQLIERYVDDLRETRVAGIHLICGEAARAFYERLGFRELLGLEYRPGVWVYTLGRRLAT